VVKPLTKAAFFPVLPFFGVSGAPRFLVFGFLVVVGAVVVLAGPVSGCSVMVVVIEAPSAAEVMTFVPLIRNTSKRFSALSEGDDWAISGIGNRDEVAVDCGIRTEP
jgi:hypothetical protein